MIPIPAMFTEAAADQAFDEWGANCGPGALAGILGLTLDEVRPHMGDFESKGYTNPTLMYAALDSLGVSYRKVRAPRTWPTFGLVRVQWEGPWMEPNVPMRARFRYTHWVGAATVSTVPGDVGIFDINCINNGTGWVSKHEWVTVVVPWLLEMYPKANGRWSLANVLEVTRV